MNLTSFLKKIVDNKIWKRLKADESGIGIIIALGSVLVMTLIAVAVLTDILGNKSLVVHERREAKSLHTADAGFNRALLLIAGLKKGTVTGVASYDIDPGNPGIDMVATVDTSQGTYTYNVNVTSGDTKYRFGITSTGFGPNGVKERIVASVDSFSIWDFNFSGGSTNGGSSVTGNVSIHGPFYVRGNLALGSSTSYHDGPVYVKSEASIPGDSGGAPNVLSGDLVLTGSAAVGSSLVPIKAYVDSQCIGCDLSPPGQNFWGDIVFGPGILDIPLPILNNDIMKAMYLGADFLWDSPIYSSSDVRDITNFNADQSFAITYNTTPSFDYTFTDRNGDGRPSGTGHFKWDLATKTLTVDGTVFVDGSVSIIGGNNELIKYAGKGTIYANGNITLSNERFRASNVSDFPVISALGLVTPGSVTITGNNCPSCNGTDDPAYQLAIFGTTNINTAKQTHFVGTIMSRTLFFNQVPDLYTHPLLSANLPPDLPGKGDELITQILGWQEVPVQ